MSTRWNWPVKVLLLSLLLLGTGLVFNSGSASADYNAMPGFIPYGAPSQYLNLTDGTSDPEVGNGANLPTSYMKVYAPPSGAIDVKLNFNFVHRAVGDPSACWGYDVKWQIWKLDGNQNLVSTADQTPISVWTCDSDYSITVPASAFTQSTDPSRGGIYVTLIKLSIASWPNSDPSTHTATMLINTVGGGKLGYSGGDAPATIYPSKNIAWHNVAMEFRAPCDYSNPSYTIKWRDDDLGTARQNEPLDLHILEWDAITGAGGGEADWSLIRWGGSGGEGQARLNIKPNHKYKFELRHVKGGNGIALLHPFDSGDFYLECPGPPDVECTATALASPIPGTSDGVERGTNFPVRVTLYNPKPWPAPPTYNGGYLSTSVSINANGNWYDTPLTTWAPRDVSGQIVGSIPPGGSVNVISWFTAPNDISSRTLHLYSDYANVMAMHGCPDLPVKTYEHFTLVGRTSSTLLPNTEDPDRVEYMTWVRNNASVPVNARTDSCLYKDPPSTGCGAGNLNGPTRIANPGTYTPGEPAGNYTQGSPGNPLRYTITPPKTAGDKYCAAISLSYTDAYVGPGGPSDIKGATGAQTFTSCPKIVNEPYFKVYGQSISTGGAFQSVTPSCDGGNGTLGGWNNNSGTNPDYGASTQLHAIALSRIYGVASGHTQFTGRSPADLTFANGSLPNPSFDGSPTVPNTSPDSPFLGGYFKNNSKVNCLTELSGDAVAGATVLSGNQVIAGRLLAVGQNQVVQVNAGSARITGNITYNEAGWGFNADGSTNIPSFKLVVKGDIYIDPSVTRLDGIYIATGKIYTCGNFGFVPATNANTNVFNTCRNQLVVHGHFVAKKVNLMRTYGSLRDEKPTPGSAIPGSLGVSAGLVWTQYGNPSTNDQGVSTAGMGCTRINEPLEPPARTWNNNYLCIRSADYTAGVRLAYTSNGAGGIPAGYVCQPQNMAGILLSLGYPIAVAFPWADNRICTNMPYINVLPSDQTNATQFCTRIYEPSDPDWPRGTSPAIYVCVPKGVAPSVTPPAPPATPLNCNNSTLAQRNGYQSPASDRPTCAAEVFDYSPELYLSKNPDVTLPDPSPHFDAITSLPPVL